MLNEAADGSRPMSYFEPTAQPLAPAHQYSPVVIVSRPIPRSPRSRCCSSCSPKADTTPAWRERIINAVEGWGQNHARNRCGQGEEERSAGLSNGEHVPGSVSPRWSCSLHHSAVHGRVRPRRGRAKRVGVWQTLEDRGLTGLTS